MLHDLSNDDGFVALKWTAEDREGWRHRERMSKTAVQQNITDDDLASETVLRFIDHQPDTNQSCETMASASRGIPLYFPAVTGTH